MIKALLLFISKFFLYISIAGGILFLLFYFGFTDIDKVLKKTLALRGLEAISIDDTRRIFDVTPKKKWWPTFIRTKYGGSMERITYRMVTLIISGKEQTLLAAVYTAPFVKPHVFFEHVLQ